jgi:molybdopterin-binding protein
MVLDGGPWCSLESPAWNNNRQETPEMNISARNNLRGRVKNVAQGAVNSEVVVELSNGVEIVAIITKESAERLQLNTGKSVYAVIKASDVMIATD